MKFASVAMALGCLLLASPAGAEDAPPSDGKSVCEIVQAVEKAGYSRVSEAIFEKGGWKVEAYKGKDRRIVRVDAKTGAVQGEAVDDDD
jgi:hypothetical protein